MFTKNYRLGPGGHPYREPVNCMTSHWCEVSVGDTRIATFETDTISAVILFVGFLAALLMWFGRRPAEQPTVPIDDDDALPLVPIDARLSDPRFEGTNRRLAAYEVLVASLADYGGEVREDLPRGIVVIDGIVIISLMPMTEEERDVSAAERRGRIVVQVETGHGVAFRYAKGGAPPFVPMTRGAFTAWFSDPVREFSWV